MAETEKKKTEDTGEEALSRKRRTALVSYLAILFAVAFLLVALSLVIENKRLQSTNAAIKNDSQKTSANLNKTITDMQTENDELTEQISALQQQLDELQTEADRQAAEAEDQISALTAEREQRAVRAAEESYLQLREKAQETVRLLDGEWQRFLCVLGDGAPEKEALPADLADKLGEIAQSLDEIGAADEDNRET